MRKLMIVVFLFLFINVFAGNQVVIREGPMNWNQSGGNPSKKSFADNVMLIKRHPLKVRKAAIEKWKKGDAHRGFTTFSKGDTFFGSTFGDNISVVWYGLVTIRFSKTIYAKYV